MMEALQVKEQSNERRADGTGRDGKAGKRWKWGLEGLEIVTLGGRGREWRRFFQTLQDVLFHFMARKSAARGSLSSVMAAFSSVSGRGFPPRFPPNLYNCSLQRQVFLLYSG